MCEFAGEITCFRGVILRIFKDATESTTDPMRTALILLVFALTISGQAQLVDDDGNPFLPHGLAPQEIKRTLPPVLTLTPPPDEAVRAIAEWEEVEAIMVRWPNLGSWNNLWVDFLEPVALDLKIYVICASGAQATAAQNLFVTRGVPLDSIEFPVQATNSVWIRDYGPWWVWRENSWDRGIVDWIYNRPRPADDAIPEWEAALWGIPYYGPNLIFTGGNFMVDGWGRGFCSELVFDENGTAVDEREELDSVMAAYMNLDTMYTFPRFFGIDHIDMSMKLLNDHTAILNEYPVGNAFDSVMDSCEEILSAIQNPWGESVTVHRVNTPTWSGGIPYTYTNAIFVNNKILLPIYNRAEDAAAIALWESLMPGYSVHGFDANVMIPQQGAIHCVIKEVVHRHLIRIEYAPLPALLYDTPSASIRARVTSLGTLNRDSLQLFFALDQAGPWQSIAFDTLGGDSFVAVLPVQLGGTPIYYYVRAENDEGNWTSMPRYGPEAHYSTMFVNSSPADPIHLVTARSGNDMRFVWRAIQQDVNGIPLDSISYVVYGSDTFDPNTGIQIAATVDTSVTVANEALNASARRYYWVRSIVP